MEFRQTLLAAQRNQQQKSSDNSYYKARFDPPKKEQKTRDRLSANIQKFLAKKDEEEKQKKLEEQKKKEEFLAMRDPKALRKIQKTLKVIKSANKSAIADAVDRDNTAVTLTGPEQPDQDDYGYESQEAAALYQKMMQKYSKLPDEPKFPTGNNTVKKDLNGTRERVKHALQHEDDPVPHKRRRRTGGDTERDLSPPPKYEPEKEKKKEDTKSDKPKFRKPLPPPMDFNQLLKLAEQKKGDPLEAVQKKIAAEAEKERPMTEKQKREYREEMARRQRRQERLDAEKNGGRKVQKDDKPPEKDKKPEPAGFTRIPKLGDKANNNRNDSPRPVDRDKSDRERAEKLHREKEKARKDREKTDRLDREKADRLDREKADRLDREKADRLDREKGDRLDREKLEREKERMDRLELLKAERERIERDIYRLKKDREKLEKTKSKLESRPDNKPVDKVDRTKVNGESKNIDLKSQNTYRIDKNSNDKKFSIPKDGNGKLLNGHSSKPVPKGKEPIVQKNGLKERPVGNKPTVNDRPIKADTRIENGKRPPEKASVSKINQDKRLPPNKIQAGPSKQKLNTSNTFDFDKHVSSLKNGHDATRNGVKKPGDMKKRPHPDDIRRKQKRRALDSESDYDSEMDDFIDDGDDEMDVSNHIKEIFGYDKSKYRDMDDDDDPMMESSFARQQREEYISKKIGIMEDLEDMRMEAMEKKKSKKSRRISDD